MKAHGRDKVEQEYVDHALGCMEDFLFLVMCICCFVVVLFNRSVMYNSLHPHEPAVGQDPCPSLTPGARSNSCLLNQ